MAKRLYNVRAYGDTAANWATNTHIYPSNSLLIATDTGAIKKGDGVKTYAQLGSLGVKQVAEVADISDWPASFPPSAHDHAVVEDATSGLVAASTIQSLAEALSARISAHDHAVVEDVTSGLTAAATIQDLAEALSARILALETAAG